MFVLLLCALGCVVGQESNDILAVRDNSSPVTTSVSGVFHGSWMTSRRKRRFQAYRGIRYAEPPVGDLRFEAPRPIRKYESPVNATEDGPACPQSASEEYPMSEDCLTINVYTAGSKSLQPVVVYIHDGGLQDVSSGRSDQVGPHYLLDKDVVLVTINYRIGSLGFLALGSKTAPGNNGYKDQVAALRWVNRNIAAFGGDPELVTIVGYGDGAASVMLHMISPMSKGLFHRAISMSGSPVPKTRSPSHLVKLSETQAKLVGCPINDTRMYACLKTKTWQELTRNRMGYFKFGNDPSKLWTAVVEPDFGHERFLTIDPVDAIREGKMHAVPFIIGLTRDEIFWKAFTIMQNKTLFDQMQADWDWVAPISFILPPVNISDDIKINSRLLMSYFRSKGLKNDTFSTEWLGKLYSDSVTGFSVHRMAVLMCIHSPQPVYYYLFNYMGEHSHYEDPVTKKPVGVAHQDDLIYLFTSNRFHAINVSDSEDSKMVDKMTTIWYNFAKTGDPMLWSSELEEKRNFSWPAMTIHNRTYLSVDNEFSVSDRLFENRFEVWEDFFRIDYGESSSKPGNSGVSWKSSLSSILFYATLIKMYL